MKAMLTYLEATRFKLLNGLMDLEGRSRVNHPMASYMDHNKDKNGLAQTVLRIPTWVAVHEAAPGGPSSSPLILEMTAGCVGDDDLDWGTVRGAADGTAEQQQHWSPSPGGAGPPPHLLTAVDLAADGSSPAFTTTNPILYSTRAEALLMRGTADGGFEGAEQETVAAAATAAAYNSKLLVCSSREQLDATEEDLTALPPDSDFDEFDSNDEDERQDNVYNRRRHEEEEEEDEDDEDRGGHNNINNSQDNEIHEIYYQEKQVAVIGRCRAIYDYTANMYDELSIRYGDVINVHDKQEDGWWLGECHGRVGIFPATYVETL